MPFETRVDAFREVAAELATLSVDGDRQVIVLDHGAERARSTGSLIDCPHIRFSRSREKGLYSAKTAPCTT